MRVWVLGAAFLLAGCNTGMLPDDIGPTRHQSFTVVNTDAPQVFCDGAYMRYRGAVTASAKVLCDDGRTGRIELNTRMDGHPVSGVVRLSGGEMSSVAFSPILREEHAFGKAPSLHRVVVQSGQKGVLRRFFKTSGGGCYYVDERDRRVYVDRNLCRRGT